ncbi:MAG: sugar ABC transporter permease, partial [Chloroflexota bacterium]|nr:sugar ABC transporter permease [Chloroflexota bacterium]
SPSILAVLFFIYAFLLWTGFTSLTLWNTVRPDFTFVGVRNFLRLFGEDRFRSDLKNTAMFAAVFIGGCIAIGFPLAALLDRKLRGGHVFRTIILLPFAASAIVTGVVWRWLESYDSGINLLFANVGLGFIKSHWFADPNIGITAVALAAVWQMAGYVMALYLAGLSNIPSELREAAAVDGCGTFALYRHVIVPQLVPVTFSVIVILGTLSLRVFDLTASMTQSGPAFADDTPAYFMFQTTFQSNQFAQGAAIATVMLIPAVFLIIPYLRSVRTEGDA